MGLLVPNGRNSATTNANVIRFWWGEYPNANLGILTGGESGLIVVDVDGAEGRKSLESLINEHGPLQPTWQARTGNGHHYYFSLSDVETVPNSAGRIGKGLDIRGEGGYIITAPSRHHSGRVYEWKDGGNPTEAELAAAPSWLITLAKESPTHSADPGEPQGPYELPETIPQGQRNDALFREVRRLRALRMSHDEIRSFVQAVNKERCNPKVPPQGT